MENELLFSPENKKTKRIPLSHAHIIGQKTLVQQKQLTEIGCGLFWSATGFIFRKNKWYWIAKWSGHSMCFLSSLWFIGSMWWRYVCLLFCSGQEPTCCSLWVQSGCIIYFKYWTLDTSGHEVISHSQPYHYFSKDSFHTGKSRHSQRKRKMRPYWKKIHKVDCQRKDRLYKESLLHWLCTPRDSFTTISPHYVSKMLPK